MTTFFCAECRVAIRTALYGGDQPAETLIADVCHECQEKLRLQMDELRAGMHAQGRHFPATGTNLRTALWEKR